MSLTNVVNLYILTSKFPLSFNPSTAEKGFCTGLTLEDT